MELGTLTFIVKRSLSNAPVTIDFELLHDVKSFWSQTVRAKLSWPPETDLTLKDSCNRLKYPSSLFFKLPFISTNAKAVDNGDSLENDLRILWNTEVTFYQEFKNKELGLFKIPKVYLAEPRTTLDNGCFVLEDMSATNGYVFSEDYIPGFSFEQVCTIVCGIADLHYYCLTCVDNSWKKECDVPIDAIANFGDIMWNGVSKLGSYDPDRIEKQLKHIENNFTMNFCLKGRHGYKDDNLPGVLIHQDLNSTNILWTEKNGVKTISAFIDFQLSTVGGICEDIVRVLCLGMSQKERKKHTNSVLELYYKRVRDLFNGNPPFSLEQVKNEYKRCFAFVNNFTLFGIACYYRQTEEEKLPLETKQAKLKEYLDRATGIIDDILYYEDR